MKPTRILSAILIGLGVTGCGSDTGPTGPPPPAPPPAPSFIRLQSDIGDWVGAGGTYEYTLADALIGVSANGVRLSVSVRGDEDWSGEFAIPNSFERLEPGTYANLTRTPFSDPAVGGVSWTGEGRGCNTIQGQLTIDAVEYEGGALSAIDLRFRQHCEGGPPALHGEIHWWADDPTQPPGPVQPPPAGLWAPAAGSTPASGNFVYLVSETGDYIGQGQTYSYTGGEVAVSGNALQLAVTVGGWSATFRGMDVLTQLERGYYGDLQRYPFHNPIKGGLSWSGNGRGCNRLTGWFVIDEIVYSAGTLNAVELRFAQHCEGGPAALRGAIRWNR